MGDPAVTKKDLQALQKDIDEVRKWFQDEKTQMNRWFQDEKNWTHGEIQKLRDELAKLRKP
jgi:hypothetical protein